MCYCQDLRAWLGQAFLLFSTKRSAVVLQENFRQGWKLPSLLVFIVGKGQHTHGVPKLREAVMHLLRGELHMSVLDGAQLPASSGVLSAMPATHPVKPHSDSFSTESGRSFVPISKPVMLNPGRLAVEHCSLLQWVRRSRDCNFIDA